MLCAMIADTLDLTPEAFAAGTGWAIKPQGACRGDACVPLGGGPFDAAATAERLRMAVVHEPAAGLWAIGPDTLGDRALTTATAPDLELPRLDGTPFRLAELRGQKVAIVSWAPW